tara:strand:- start:40 stop:192 length:153 start_codon:yes stop_codon:yes gene_type:complete
MKSSAADTWAVVFGYFFVVIAGWLVLTSTLDDMTHRDCQHGVQTACEALK